MYFIVFLLASCFILFLFSFFLLTKDDFIILRKDISMERIFNFAVLACLAGLFSARLFYVIFNFQPKFLNLFVFFLFAHFPGLSLVGAVIGGSLFSFVYLKAKKMPALHLFDFVLLSFLAALPFGAFLYLLSFKKIDAPLGLLFPFLFLISFVAMFVIFKKLRLQDGSLGALSLILFSLILLITSRLGTKLILILKGDDILLIIIFLISLVIFIRLEKLLDKFKR